MHKVLSLVTIASAIRTVIVPRFQMSLGPLGPDLVVLTSCVLHSLLQRSLEPERSQRDPLEVLRYPPQLASPALQAAAAAARGPQSRLHRHQLGEAAAAVEAVEVAGQTCWLGRFLLLVFRIVTDSLLRSSTKGTSPATVPS